MKSIGESKCNLKFAAHSLCSVLLVFVQTWFVSLVAIGCVALCISGCQQQHTAVNTVEIKSLRPIGLSAPWQVKPAEGSLALRLARNEFGDIAFEFAPTSNEAQVLRIVSPTSVAVSVYQVLTVPVDLNSADFIRQTGQLAGATSIPQVLLPIPTSNGVIDLAAARDPDQPTQHAHFGGKPIQFWVEFHALSNAARGELHAGIQLSKTSSAPTETLPIEITLLDFEMPRQSQCPIAAQVDWESLIQHYPSVFDGVTARLLNRHDTQSAPAVRLLDQLVSLAHENQTDIFFTRLQPTVKWPPAHSPKIDWNDFDSLVSPWLSGDAFADHTGIGFSTIPWPDYLDDYDQSSRNEYWKLAAEHFDQKKWLNQSAVLLNTDAHEPANAAETLILSAQADQILSANPKVKALLPINEDKSDARKITLAPGPIVSAGQQSSASKHWMLADPSVAGEADIRTIAYLAFVQNVSPIIFKNPLPGPSSHITWFYPGEMFGVTGPIPTIQLKWLRSASQDLKYLALALQKSRSENANLIAKLIAKPVQPPANDASDSRLTLLAGTSSAKAISDAHELLAEMISPQAINPDVSVFHWTATQQSAMIFTRGVKWEWNTGEDRQPGNWLNATICLDIFSPAVQIPSGSLLQWTQVAQGWEIHPQPSVLAHILPFQVTPVTATAQFNLDRITRDSSQTLELALQDVENSQQSSCKFRLPVAVSNRRSHPLDLNGSLEDWDDADSIQLNQPLVQMLNRPAIQHQEIQPGTLPVSIYSAWSDENFYVSFRLPGISQVDTSSMRNFVNYQDGRAWGEDLCELLVQPIYADNTLGPTLHIVCKPSGNWMEQSPANATDNDVWQPLEGAGIRYASGIEASAKVWRGELAIPWRAFSESKHGRPTLLRFNFTQHRKDTGESASWTGPIDFGRDKSMMGLLYLK